MALSIRSLEKLIVDRAEQRTRGGRQPLRTLEYDLRLAAPDGSGRLAFAEFERAVASYAPGAERHALRALYDHHARADVDAPAGPRSFSVDASSFARALFAKEIAPPPAEAPAPAPTAAAAAVAPPGDDAGTGGRRPTQQRRPAAAAAAAADGAAAAVPLARVAERAAARPPLEELPTSDNPHQRQLLHSEADLDSSVGMRDGTYDSRATSARTNGGGGGGGGGGGTTAALKQQLASAVAAEDYRAAAELKKAIAAQEDRLRRAVADLNGAIGAAVDAHGGVLPAKQRLQLHATQAASASRQIALLRAFGAVGVPVERLPARVSEAQLAAALAPFGRYATARPPSFVAPRTVQALWAAAADGDVSSLLQLICPVVPAAAAAAAAAPAARAAAAGRLESRESDVMDGPWDRASGRKGVRHVAAPATLPAAVRYRFCAAPVHVPPDFTPDMVTRSAKKPPVMLRRRAVNGYNGLGTHNRAPNVHTPSARTQRERRPALSLPRLTTPLLPLQVHALGDGRLLFASAALGIVHDTASGAQHYYEGHDDDVTAVALHPAGELAATAQIASAWSGTRPWIAVWRVTDGTEVRRVGWVADPNATDARGSDPRANAAAPPRPRRRRRAASLRRAARAAASAAVRQEARSLRRRPDPSVLRAVDLCVGVFAGRLPSHRRRLRRPTHHRRVGLAAWRAVGVSSGTHGAASRDPPTLRCADVGPRRRDSRDGSNRGSGARVSLLPLTAPLLPLQAPRCSSSASASPPRPSSGRSRSRRRARRRAAGSSHPSSDSSASKRTRRRRNRSPRWPSAVRRSRRSPARRTASSSSAAPWGASSFDVPLVGGRDGAADTPASDIPETSRLTLPCSSLLPAAPATGPAYAPSYLAYVDAHEERSPPSPSLALPSPPAVPTAS